MMASVGPVGPPSLVVPPRRRVATRARSSGARGDQLIYLLAWAAGIGLCVVAGAIVAYLGVQGVRYIAPSLLASRPSA